MICNECRVDKPGPDLDGLPVADVVRLCREWRCQKCSRTPEQVQRDYVAASVKELHEPAHDWDALAMLMVQGLVESEPATQWFRTAPASVQPSLKVTVRGVEVRAGRSTMGGDVSGPCLVADANLSGDGTPAFLAKPV